MPSLHPSAAVVFAERPRVSADVRPRQRTNMIESAWLVFQDEKYVVEQCRGVPLPGYLVVRPRAKVRGLAVLSDQDAGALGILLRRLVQAIELSVRPVRVYVAQFGEEDESLHFHLFPRTEALTRKYLQEFPEQRAALHGPLLLDWARERFRGVEVSEEALRVLNGLKDYMTTEA